jgi:hypothetical protein
MESGAEIISSGSGGEETDLLSSCREPALMFGTIVEFEVTCNLFWFRNQLRLNSFPLQIDITYRRL